MYLCSASCQLHVFRCFCQAEDGIRDLVRSRGLGDVYKRQAQNGTLNGFGLDLTELKKKLLPTTNFFGKLNVDTLISVSYTHLTLPTSDLV